MTPTIPHSAKTIQLPIVPVEDIYAKYFVSVAPIKESNLAIGSLQMKSTWSNKVF